MNSNAVFKLEFLLHVTVDLHIELDGNKTILRRDLEPVWIGV